MYVSAYIGNSIMGNILGTSLLRGGSKTEAGVGRLTHRMHEPLEDRGGTLHGTAGLRTSPPVIAVVVGLLCHLPAGPILSQYGAGFYRVLTWVSALSDYRAGHVARCRQTAPRRP